MKKNISKTVLVTGGAGFLGSHIVDALIKKKYNVIIVDNLSTGKKENLNPMAKFYKTDIFNKKELERIFIKEKPDIISHHAAKINVQKSINNPIPDAKINILGILNVLELVKKYCIKKILFASSAGVYGETKIIPTPENYTLNPPSPYGITKLTGEYYLHFYKNFFGINSTILRYANVFGPRQSSLGEGGVVSVFIDRLLDKKHLVINGSGNQTRDFIYVDDVVSANLLAFESKVNGTFNIGTGIETSINQLFSILLSISDVKIERKYDKNASEGQKRSCLDSLMANSILKWSPKNNLVQGLKKTINGFKERRYAREAVNNKYK